MDNDMKVRMTECRVQLILLVTFCTLFSACEKEKKGVPDEMVDDAFRRH